jgi:hypothetical protein
MTERIQPDLQPAEPEVEKDLETEVNPERRSEKPEKLLSENEGDILHPGGKTVEEGADLAPEKSEEG